MINLSKVIYKATGIMSKKQIMKTCGKIGNEVSENFSFAKELFLANEFIEVLRP